MTNLNWTPKIGGKYYVFYASHQCRGVRKMIFADSPIDKSYMASGNFFKRKADAVFALKLLGDAALH